MDGTTTQIIGELLNFAISTNTIPSVSPGILIYHYVMKTPKHRLFIDSVLLSAMKQLDSQKFFARFPRKLRRHLIRYRQSFCRSSIIAENQKWVTYPCKRDKRSKTVPSGKYVLNVND